MSLTASGRLTQIGVRAAVAVVLPVSVLACSNLLRQPAYVPRLLVFSHMIVHGSSSIVMMLRIHLDENRIVQRIAYNHLVAGICNPTSTAVTNANFSPLLYVE